ncbi:MAG TPA: DUF3180 family protein [Pseudolysinimonas sp.]|nr:DUF3180 family protein [Pseudolysinimonas sp.]
MTRTKPLSLIIAAVIGVGAGLVLQAVLAAASQPKLRPEYTLAITVVLIGVAAVVLALPVRRATRGNPAHRVDPFYATRVVVLAKASAVAGALLAGGGTGLLLELLARAGEPGADMFLRAASVAAGGALLLAGGLVAEWLCTVPKDADDDPGAGPAAPAG